MPGTHMGLRKAQRVDYEQPRVLTWPVSHLIEVALKLTCSYCSEIPFSYDLVEETQFQNNLPDCYPPGLTERKVHI